MSHRKQKPKQTCRIRWIYIMVITRGGFRAYIQLYISIHVYSHQHAHTRIWEKRNTSGTRQEQFWCLHTHIYKTRMHTQIAPIHTYTYTHTHKYAHARNKTRMHTQITPTHTRTRTHTHKYAHARMHAYKDTHLRNIRSSLRKLQEQCWFFERREQGVCQILGEILPRVLLLLLHSYLWLVHTSPCRHVVFRTQASARKHSMNAQTIWNITLWFVFRTMLMLPRGNIDGGVNARACGMCHIATISATHMASFDAVILALKPTCARQV